MVNKKLEIITKCYHYINTVDATQVAVKTIIIIININHQGPENKENIYSLPYNFNHLHAS